MRINATWVGVCAFIGSACAVAVDGPAVVDTSTEVAYGVDVGSAAEPGEEVAANSPSEPTAPEEVELTPLPAPAPPTAAVPAARREDSKGSVPSDSGGPGEADATLDALFPSTCHAKRVPLPNAQLGGMPTAMSVAHGAIAVVGVGGKSKVPYVVRVALDGTPTETTSFHDLKATDVSALAAIPCAAGGLLVTVGPVTPAPDGLVLRIDDAGTVTFSAPASGPLIPDISGPALLAAGEAGLTTIAQPTQGGNLLLYSVTDSLKWLPMTTPLAGLGAPTPRRILAVGSATLILAPQELAAVPNGDVSGTVPFRSELGLPLCEPRATDALALVNGHVIVAGRDACTSRPFSVELDESGRTVRSMSPEVKLPASVKLLAAADGGLAVAALANTTGSGEATSGWLARLGPLGDTAWNVSGTVDEAGTPARTVTVAERADSQSFVIGGTDNGVPYLALLFDNLLCCGSASESCSEPTNSSATVCPGPQKVGGTAVPGCDDNNPCTLEACDPTVGCVYAALLDIPCNDGNPATEYDRCHGAICIGTSKSPCGESGACIADFAAPKSTCKYISANQPGLIWQQVLGSPHSREIGRAVAMTPKGRVMVAAESDGVGGTSTDLWLLSLSIDGNVEWEVSDASSTEDVVEDVATLGEETVVLVTRRTGFGPGASWIVRYSASGVHVNDVLLTGTEQFHGRAMAIGPEGELVIAGSELKAGEAADREPVLLKVGPDGSAQKSQSIQTAATAVGDATAVVVLSTGDVAAAYGALLEDALVPRLAFMAKKSWQSWELANSGFWHLAARDDDAIVFAGGAPFTETPWIGRVSAAGNVAWAGAYGGVDNAEVAAFDVAVLGGGTVVVVGEQRKQSSAKALRRPWELILEDPGSVMSGYSGTYPTGGLRRVAPAKSGGFVEVGWVAGGPTSPPDLLVLRRTVSSSVCKVAP